MLSIGIFQDDDALVINKMSGKNNVTVGGWWFCTIRFGAN